MEGDFHFGHSESPKKKSPFFYSGEDMKKMNYKGFTLIEVLVVVLIIGILAAVALPQYKKAVEKTKVSEALMNTQIILDSMQRFLLKNGGFPSENVEFKDFADVDLSGGEWNDKSYITKDFEYYYPFCGSTFCSVEIYKHGYTYTLLPIVNEEETIKVCYTEETDIGRYICKYLESQGWEYVEGEF